MSLRVYNMVGNKRRILCKYCRREPPCFFCVFLPKSELLYRNMRGNKREWSHSWKVTREIVFYRDRGICQLCGCIVDKHWNVHHIYMRAKGGRNHPSNLILLCSHCHDRVHLERGASDIIMARVNTRYWYRLGRRMSRK